MTTDDPIEVSTLDLRPHDLVVDSPDGGIPDGAEVRMVLDDAGSPWPEVPEGTLLVLCAKGLSGRYHAAERWRIRRGAFDDCRSCFIHRAVADLGAG